MEFNPHPELAEFNPYPKSADSTKHHTFFLLDYNVIIL